MQKLHFPRPVTERSRSYWLAAQPQPQRMNEIEIAGILHVQYRDLQCYIVSIILYQNGHSGTEPPEIVSAYILYFTFLGIHVWMLSVHVA